MKTKEEVISGLKYCTSDHIPTMCFHCPYKNEPRCRFKLKKDALELIEMLTNRIPESWKESVLQSFIKGE